MSSPKSFLSYPLCIDTIYEDIESYGGGHLYKSYNDYFVNTYGIQFCESLEFENLAYEQGFVNNGRNYIFMEKDVINHLYALKYHAKTMINLTLPFDSFAISPASNARIEGELVMPILVLSTNAVCKGVSDISKAFEGQMSAKAKSSESLITLVVCEDNKRLGNKISSSFTPSQLAMILQKDSEYEALSEIFGSYSEEMTNPPNKEQGVKLIKAIKLVASFLLYNQVTQDEFLVDGFPKGFAMKPKKLGLNKQNVNSVRGCLFNVDTSKNDSKKSHHVRVGHYRQLMHERYYQGEYTGLERGSRWIPVSPSIIGGGEAFTQLTQ
jgi:hypothetical protein